MDSNIKTVEGIAYWANITVPSTTFEPTYQVEVVVDDAVADAFEADGFPTINGTSKRQDGSLKTSDHYEGRAVMIKRRVSRKDGTPNVKPKLYDSNGEQVDLTVGNGSRVLVKYREWEVENQFGRFQGLDLVKVKIIDLVEYTGGGGDNDDFNDDEF
mgnify:FL=1|jgi:hypothetical protein|tara:strand:+ start:1069 stop:1539 length:471 start_codon:yes stop_codon:yes gene_type:complete